MSLDASERDELTRELARRALHRAAPDELAIFDDLVVEYFADPQAALHAVDRDETLGFGLDLTLLTPYLLAVAGYVLPLLNDMMTEVAKESVTFATGKWTLSDEAKATLTALAQRLKSENKNVFIEIRGHADVRGSRQSNRQLGRERAGAVGRFLAEQGVPGNRMMAGSWGEDQPKTDEKTSEANAENRRVDIVVVA